MRTTCIACSNGFHSRHVAYLSDGTNCLCKWCAPEGEGNATAA